MNLYIKYIQVEFFIWFFYFSFENKNYYLSSSDSYYSLATHNATIS